MTREIKEPVTITLFYVYRIPRHKWERPVSMNPQTECCGFHFHSTLIIHNPLETKTTCPTVNSTVFSISGHLQLNNHTEWKQWSIRSLIEHGPLTTWFHIANLNDCWRRKALTLSLSVPFLHCASTSFKGGQWAQVLYQSLFTCKSPTQASMISWHSLTALFFILTDYLRSNLEGDTGHLSHHWAGEVKLGVQNSSH